MSAPRLIDDCFLHDKDRLKHAEVLTLLHERLAHVTGVEEVALAAASGRVSAEELRAPRQVPLNDNSAVDGYAFAHADLGEDDTLLPVAMRIAAGHPADEPLAAGHAARIFTGAVMPQGAETVAMQEDCEAIDIDGVAHVRLPAGLKRGANCRKAGEDLEAGAVLIDEAQVLRPQDVAAAASIGRASIKVHERLRVALYSSGDELAASGNEPADGQVFDANRPLLAALMAHLPVDITDLGVLRDDASTVREALASAAGTHDVILTTGGASRGDEDHLVESLDALGKRHLWQIAIKPGRPMCLGQIGETVVFGLPGNPVAAFVCFLLYVRPALLQLCGAAWRDPVRFYLPAGFEIARKKPDRREFLRGMLVPGPDGPTVEKFARDGSGLISGLRAADGLIELPEEATGVTRGEPVAFIPFSELGLVG